VRSEHVDYSELPFYSLAATRRPAEQ